MKLAIAEAMAESMLSAVERLTFSPSNASNKYELQPSMIQFTCLRVGLI